MATKTNTPPASRMVEIEVPFDKDKNSQPLIIAVNGVNWSIPLDGGKHLVPDYVAYEYNRSKEAEKTFAMTQAELLEQSKFS